MVRFQIRGMINPLAPLPRQFEAKFENGCIQASGYTLYPIDHCNFQEGDLLNVRLSLAGFFVAELKSEVEKRRAAELEEDERQRRISHEREIKRKQEAIDFNRELARILPFSWDVGMNDVLSGLSEESYGDGRNKRTVMHIRVKENIHIGRLKRHEFEFLCGGNGKNWSGAPSGHTDEKVSCKECLRIAERLRRSSGEECE